AHALEVHASRRGDHEEPPVGGPALGLPVRRASVVRRPTRAAVLHLPAGRRPEPGGGQLFRKLTIFLVAAVPVLLLLGLVRAVALLRRGTGATWRDAMGAFFI